jgi:glycine/D-amino acid oxidase-like deaminating enzyme
VTSALERRYRDRSLWLEGLPGGLEPRPAVADDADCDVAIVGAGFTGLWTAYYLKTLQPDLRVTVLEREIAGFGASGRNGGWVSAGMASMPSRLARSHGEDAVRRAEQETFRTVDEIGRVVVAEGIDCGFSKQGTVTIAASRPQLERMRASIKRKRHLGWGADDVQELSPAELDAHVHARSALGAMHSPHCARVDPARLARGLADACERHGVLIAERSPVVDIQPGRALCTGGTVRAATVVRATESFTVQLPRERRRFLPLYSLMIATEPLSAGVWDDLGWRDGLTVADFRHLFFYAQRTTDGRIAIGGRGAPYRLGSPIDERCERSDNVRERLTSTLRRHFPAAADASITHHWGGALAVPRDWCSSVSYDPVTGLAAAGGYSGHGVLQANISGRTLADLILRRTTDLVTMPWVGHRSRNWEPEPLRFVASRSIVGILGSADGVEGGLDHTARRVKLIQPFVAPR